MEQECEDCREFHNKETVEGIEFLPNPQYTIWMDLKRTNHNEESAPPKELWLCDDCSHQRFMDT